MSKYGYHLLLEAEQIWSSKMGGTIPGERAVFRGEDVFENFHDMSWITMLYFCVTGRKPTESAEKFLNGLFCMCFNYADPRIWNNRVSALAGNVSSTAHLGVCSASAISEATIYGGPPALRALDFLNRAKKHLDSGGDLEALVLSELRAHGTVYGFGRPVNENDERVGPALELLKKHDLHDRYYIRLLLNIGELLTKRKLGMNLNIGGITAAFSADEEFTPMELNHLLVVCFYIGQLACYIDSSSKSVGTLFPLRCERIAYAGKDFREW